MVATIERLDVGRKKSETRKHTGMLRVGSEVLDDARMAASMMRLSLADWATAVIAEASKRDIQKQAEKLVAGPTADAKAKPKR